MNTRIILKRSILGPICHCEAEGRSNLSRLLRSLRSLAMTFLLLSLLIAIASAAVPAKINYQGKLKESGALVNTAAGIVILEEI